MSRSDPTHPKVLLVEGKTDKFLLPELLEANGVDWPDEPHPVEIVHVGGFAKLVGPARLKNALQTSGRQVVGVLFDADEPDDHRWVRIRDRARKDGLELPDDLPQTGLIIPANAKRPRFGAWMMPDNQSRGMLETFLHVLVRDPQGPLWTHAGEASRAAQTHNPDLGERALDKARIHAWLAWQKDPGRQLHQAVKERILDPSADASRPFVSWFRTLFDV